MILMLIEMLLRIEDRLDKRRRQKLAESERRMREELK